MAVHEEVLHAALRICRERGGWRFRPVEIVGALPHLHAATVRTHVVSRCCVNAPRNHPHRWDYFERLSRGTYEIRRPYRRRPGARRSVVAERPAVYGAGKVSAGSDTIHAVVGRSGDWYVAECLEITVVTQGRTLDGVVSNLQEAVDLHLEGEDAAAFGLVSPARIAILYEISARRR